jgi:hypothetical protein
LERIIERSWRLLIVVRCLENLLPIIFLIQGTSIVGPPTISSVTGCSGIELVCNLQFFRPSAHEHRDPQRELFISSGCPGKQRVGAPSGPRVPSSRTGLTRRSNRCTVGFVDCQYRPAPC